MDELPEGRLRDALLREKPAEILVFIGRDNEPKYVTQISKAVDCTFSHVIRLLETFRDLALVEFQKVGRMKLVRLTPDGRDIAHDLAGVMMKIKRVEGAQRKKKKKAGKPTRAKGGRAAQASTAPPSQETAN